MPINIGISGVNRPVTPSVGVGGVWKPITGAWIGVGGVWRRMIETIFAQLTGRSITWATASPADARVGYRLTSSGLVEGSRGASILWNQDYGTWRVLGTSSDYEVRATLNSGTLTSGTTGSWLSLGTTRAWTVEVTTNGNALQTANLTIEIRRTSNSEVVATAGVAFSAEVSI